MSIKVDGLSKRFGGLSPVHSATENQIVRLRREKVVKIFLIAQRRFKMGLRGWIAQVVIVTARSGVGAIQDGPAVAFTHHEPEGVQ